VKDTHPALHPGQTARIKLGGQAIGWLGTMHPKWAQAQEFSSAPVLFEISLDALQSQPMPIVQELSKQPVVQRDMAVWVAADKPVGALFDTIKATIAANPELSVVRDFRLFDVWRDKNAAVDATVTKEKSLAFRFWLQDTDVTLDDVRVDACLLQIRSALENIHQARQR